MPNLGFKLSLIIFFPTWIDEIVVRERVWLSRGFYFVYFIFIFQFSEQFKISTLWLEWFFFSSFFFNLSF